MSELEFLDAIDCSMRESEQYLLIHHPLIILHQETLEMLCTFMPVYGITHLFSYMRREYPPSSAAMRYIAFHCTAE